MKQVIEREYRVTYHLNYLPRLLRRLDWSRQPPLSRAAEREEAVIRAWLAHDWPRIKKARRRGLDVVFFDEFGCSFVERLRRTWAPRGQRPVVRQVTRERRPLTTAVGLTLSGHIYTQYFEGGMKSRDVIACLKHLLRYLPVGFILVCDHASIHTSRETLGFLFEHPEIIVEPLPKYAPELNPEEYCHGHVKAQLANATPTDAEQMRHLLEQGFARLRRKPHLLLSFIHAAGLAVNQLWLN